jgi:hypothetical protein
MHAIAGPFKGQGCLCADSFAMPGAASAAAAAGAALVPPGWIAALHYRRMGAWLDDCSSIMSCASIQQCKRMVVSLDKYPTLK